MVVINLHKTNDCNETDRCPQNQHFSENYQRLTLTTSTRTRARALVLLLSLGLALVPLLLRRGLALGCVR